MFLIHAAGMVNMSVNLANIVEVAGEFVSQRRRNIKYYEPMRYSLNDRRLADAGH